MIPRARWCRRGLGAAGVGVAGGVLAALGGRRRWRRRGAELLQELKGAAAGGGEPMRYDRLGDLPPPVERYFRRVLPEGQPRIRAAVTHQRGTFRSREGGDAGSGWAPFTAVQHFTADPPGFVWDARIQMAPLLAMRVRDGYVAGSATMRGAIGAVIPVVSADDGPELRAGALQRWLAEAVWLPTALLPRAGLSWSAVDDRHARATLTDRTTTVSLDFEFGPEGDIVAAHAPARLRAAPGRPGRYRPSPWGGRYRGFEEWDGVRVPTESEVYWVLDGRETPYYRGRSIRVEFEY